MPDAQKDLAALGVSVSADDGFAFDGITFLSGARQVTAHFAQGRGIGIRRPRLHQRLVERCEALGVRLAWGSRVGITSGAPFQLDGKPCLYRYAVGADGQSSRVRLALGIGEGKVLSRRFGARCHYRMQPWSQQVEVHWGDLGQAYVTPVGPDEIGVATVARSPAHRMEEVLASLPLLRSRLCGANIVTTMRGAVTTTRRLTTVTARSTSLIGDASGSADAITGEGIALSFRQALLLAEAMAVDDLSIYQRGHGGILRRPHLMSRAMLAMDARPWLRDQLFVRLARQPQLFANLLAFHLGERSAGDFLSDLPMLGLRFLWPMAPTRTC